MNHGMGVINCHTLAAVMLPKGNRYRETQSDRDQQVKRRSTELERFQGRLRGIFRKKLARALMCELQTWI